MPAKDRKSKVGQPLRGSRRRHRARGDRRHHRLCRVKWQVGARVSPIIACATGDCHGSAIGAAPFRWFIATIAAWCLKRKENLPVELPYDEDGLPIDFGVPGNPSGPPPDLARCAIAPSCGKPAKRETDTMDTFVDSSWYFARFTSTPRRITPTVSRRRRLLDERRSVHRRDRTRDSAPSLFPLFRPRDAHLRPPARKRHRTLRRALYPGHGDPCRFTPTTKDAGRMAARSITTRKTWNFDDGKPETSR